MPGLYSFAGTVSHAAGYREPGPFAGERVVIVGAGNSAAQIGAELAEHAEVTLTTRKPVGFVNRRPLGLDLQFWFTVTRLGLLPVGSRHRRPRRVPVLDTGVYRRAIRAGRPEQRKGLSTTHPGLGFVGLEWQRGLLSAGLRGVGRDARYVARRLSRR
ncbi:hypothetical protein [Amycolatopsis acididurans]|uniref:hypothetical protein n=1 Tax=Amycolatopsis acididurans TaxID=2724524 RepID=UPI0028A9155B|nr:hypothetical protein [Amycolatopsis acididurans]